MTGIERIAAERKRQLELEGPGAVEHDDKCYFGQLADAAACYAATCRIRRIDGSAPFPWLWKPKPLYRNEVTRKRIKQLAYAGALLAAEIDRIERIIAEAREAREHAARAGEPEVKP